MLIFYEEAAARAHLPRPTSVPCGLVMATNRALSYSEYESSLLSPPHSSNEQEPHVPTQATNHHDKLVANLAMLYSQMIKSSWLNNHREINMTIKSNTFDAFVDPSEFSASYMFLPEYIVPQRSVLG